eukprot:gene5381-6053_t
MMTFAQVHRRPRLASALRKIYLSKYHSSEIASKRMSWLSIQRKINYHCPKAVEILNTQRWLSSSFQIKDLNNIGVHGVTSGTSNVFQNFRSQNLSVLCPSLSSDDYPLNRFTKRQFHSSTFLSEIKDERKIILDEKSKLEEFVEHQKKKRANSMQKADSLGSQLQDAFIFQPEKKAVEEKKEKLSIQERIMKEVNHYYNGFRLLYLDCKVAAKLLWQVLNGKTLSRRERRQFLRTVADLFRLVPFMVFLIIPFMEFLLPVVIKLFPNMLPSTFEDKSKKEEARKKSLKVKIQMARFLQDTIEESELMSKTKKTEKKLKEFANFVQRIRTGSEQPSNEEIMNYSKLFEDEITLENMTHGQLKALCRLLMLSAVGTSNYLRFSLKMKLQQLKADDKLIRKEGLDKLSTTELQQACVSRGMRGLGVPVERLKSQLKQWLELSLDEEVPATLLLMSRALYIPESLSSPEQLKVTLSQLPERVVDEMEMKIAVIEGEEVDRKTRIDIITDEEEKIRAERQEESRLEQEKQEKLAAAEELKDKAESLQEKLLNVKETISSHRDDLDILKEDRKDYQEGLKELAKEPKAVEVTESKASERLGKKVDTWIEKIDEDLNEIDETPIDADNDGIITTDELFIALQKNDGLSENKAREICELLDFDKDGSLDLDELKQAVELIEKEDLRITDEQVIELMQHIKRGEDILVIEQMLSKEKSNAILRLDW